MNKKEKKKKKKQQKKKKKNREQICPIGKMVWMPAGVSKSKKKKKKKSCNIDPVPEGWKREGPKILVDEKITKKQHHTTQTGGKRLKKNICKRNKKRGHSKKGKDYINDMSNPQKILAEKLLAIQGKKERKKF